MKKFVISDLQSLRQYLESVKNPIFGIGARAYNLTIGAHSLFKNFTILACNGRSKEISLLQERVPIIYSEKNPVSRDLENHKTYQAKKPLDILKNKKIIEYLDSFKEKPVLLFFKMSQEIEDILDKKGYISVGSSYSMFKKYENKITFQNLLDTLGIVSPKHSIIRASRLDYNDIKRKLGEKFVIQLPNSELGAGTFFVLNKNDFAKTYDQEPIQRAIEKNIDLRVTEYMEPSCSPSITVCVTKFGIISTGLQKQILDAKEVLESKRRSGVYCGHDWTSSKFESEIEKQAQFIAENIGNAFKKEGFSGIFGIDFIVNNDTLYPIEANVRLLGSFPVFSAVQQSAGHPVIQGLQILEKLERTDYELDVKSLNSLMQQYKCGAHINLYSRNSEPIFVSGDIQPGVYKIDSKMNISYIRKGIFFDDLKEDTEILLTGPVPYKGHVYQRHGMICKLISRSSFMNINDRELNDFAKTMIRYTYDKLDLKIVP